MARVAVVGAGAGGLAAAARLAAQGHAVTVLEQAAVPGGALASYTRDGFVFDTGPAQLTLPAVYRDLFLKTARRRAGGALEDAVGLVMPERAFTYRWADGTSADLPAAGVRRSAEALGAALGGRAVDDWERLMRRAAGMWEATRHWVAEPPQGDPLGRRARLRGARALAPRQTLRGLSRRATHDPRLVLLLDRYATGSGSDPRRAAAALAVAPYVEQTFGVWHVEGGLGRLATALHDRCVARGVVFRYGADVVEVVVDGGRVAGVRLAGAGAPRELVAADVVVADCDALVLYRDLLAGRGDAPRRTASLGPLASAAPSASVFVLLLALDGDVPDVAHHTVLLADDPDAGLDATFGSSPRPPDDPTLQVCAPDDPAMRPGPHARAWSVRVPAPVHDPLQGVDWAEPGVADAYGRRVLDMMAARGLDVRDRLRWFETRTPADLARTTRWPGGGLRGPSGPGGRAPAGASANRSPVPGLFLVGGSARPGGGLPLVGLSAQAVAAQVGRG